MSAGKFNQPDAIGEGGQFLCADLDRQARLACAARTRQRDEAAGLSSSLTSAISFSRPMKLVSCAGKLFGITFKVRRAENR